MRVERLGPSEIGSQRFDVAVVIDVLRATSTAAVLCARAAELAVIASPAESERLPPREGGYLFVSELDAAAALGARVDNSPSLARTLPLDGKTPVLVTTNGTRALAKAAERSARVLLASFLNVGAIARALRAAAPAHVAIIPAGDFARGEPHVEDELCAGALAELVAGARPDFAALAARVRDDARVRRRLERTPALADDVDLALTPDLYPVAPEFHPTAPGVGWIRCPAP